MCVCADHSTFAKPPGKFEAGTPAICEAIGLGVACDYLDAIKGVAIKSAHKLLKQHKTAEKVAKFLGMEGKFPDGPAGLAEYLEQLQQAKETFRHQRVYDPKLKKVVPLTPPPPNAPIMPHCGADIADDLAYKLCELGALHPETWQQLVVPGAPPERPQQQQPQPQPLPPPPPPAHVALRSRVAQV